jgi:putative ABC transport system substrate-binding protein
MMDRRSFIGGLGLGALAWPREVSAQSAARIARVGILGFAATTEEISGPEPRRPSARFLLRGLREMGYVYGRDFVTEPRGAEGKPDLWPVQAAEMVNLKVDVIVAPGPYLPALKRVTSAIPIVMAAAADPVGDGYAQSLAHPGGSMTGLSLQEIETTGKRLELLKELVPSASPVAVLWSNVRANSIRYWHAAETAARNRDWKLLRIEIRDAGELERAFRTAASARAGALMTIASPLLFGRARQLAQLAAAHRLPAMYDLAEYVEAGGLISYGADLDEIWRRAATFVDKILKGARPAELPIEQPSKFDLVLNLKTAQALGLTIPPSLRARVDQVIE